MQLIKMSGMQRTKYLEILALKSYIKNKYYERNLLSFKSNVMKGIHCRREKSNITDVFIREETEIHKQK